MTDRRATFATVHWAGWWTDLSGTYLGGPNCDVRRGVFFKKRLVTANHTHAWSYNTSLLTTLPGSGVPLPPGSAPRFHTYIRGHCVDRITRCLTAPYPEEGDDVVLGDGLEEAGRARQRLEARAARGEE